MPHANLRVAIEGMKIYENWL